MTVGSASSIISMNVFTTCFIRPKVHRHHFLPKIVQQLFIGMRKEAHRTSSNIIVIISTVYLKCVRKPSADIDKQPMLDISAMSI